MIADQLKEENATLAKREAQIAQLKNELASAFTLRELAWEAIKNGSDPAYVAMRYGFPIEEMKKARAVHEQREKEKQERLEARAGNES